MEFCRNIHYSDWYEVHTSTYTYTLGVFRIFEFEQMSGHVSHLEQSYTVLTKKVPFYTIGMTGSQPNLSLLGLEKEFECSVCLEEMRPPAKIFACRNGHVMCGECQQRPEAGAERCPSCRVPLRGPWFHYRYISSAKCNTCNFTFQGKVARV